MAAVKSSLALVQAGAARALPGYTPQEPAEAEVGIFGQADAVAAISHFEEALGGRDALVGELLLVPELSEQVRTLVALVFDPVHREKPLGTLCAKAGLTPGQVFTAFRDVLAAKATIQAMRLAANQVVKVMQHIVIDAVDHEDTCQTCRGKGTVPDLPRKSRKKAAPASVAAKDVTCPTCNGTTQILVRADREAQKLVLELATVLKKGTGATVNVGVTQTNQQGIQGVGGGVTQAAAVQGGFVALQQAASQLLFGTQFSTPPSPSASPDSASAASIVPDVIDVPSGPSPEPVP